MTGRGVLLEAARDTHRPETARDSGRRLPETIDRIDKMLSSGEVGGATASRGVSCIALPNLNLNGCRYLRGLAALRPFYGAFPRWSSA